MNKQNQNQKQNYNNNQKYRQNYNQNHNNNQKHEQKQVEKLTNTNFAIKAENVMKSMVQTDRKGNRSIELTTSKIRNLLSMTNVLYNQARQLRTDTLPEEIIKDVQYLKMRFAYESGREFSVKRFVEKAEIMDHINNIGDRRENLLLFCNYMESLVAYHRYYGGKDR